MPLANRAGNTWQRGLRGRSPRNASCSPLRLEAKGGRGDVMDEPRVDRKEPVMDTVQAPAADRTTWSVTLSEDEILALIGHLLSSAELCLNEPQFYGSFRLLDATSRLLSTLLSKSPANRDAFLTRLKQEIDRNKVLMIYDSVGYQDFVQQVPVLLAARLKERFQLEGGRDDG